MASRRVNRFIGDAGDFKEVSREEFEAHRAKRREETRLQNEYQQALKEHQEALKEQEAAQAELDRIMSAQSRRGA